MTEQMKPEHFFFHLKPFVDHRSKLLWLNVAQEPTSRAKYDCLKYKK